MRPAEEILAALREQDLYDTCVAFAAEHHVSLELVCTPDRHRDVVAARHAMWVYQLEELCLEYSTVARIWGVDHSSIMYAEAKALRAVARVVLNQYPPPPDEPAFTFEWVKREGCQFGVFNVRREEAMWFASYALARATFVALCEDAGAPTCRKIATGEVAIPPVLEESGVVAVAPKGGA